MFRRARPLLLVFLATLLSACSIAPSSFEISGKQDYSTVSTFDIILAISGGLFLLIVGLLVYSMVRYRARPGAPEPAQVTGNRNLEIGFISLAVILIGIAFVFSVGSMVTLAQPAPSPLRLVIIGHQWWWEYRYPDLGVVTANELHIPTDVPMRVEVESADVQHDFWLPQFGRMIDAYPGRTNVLNVTVNTPGPLEGTCNQFCGAQHAWMRITGVAETPAQFNAWVAQQKATPPPPSGALARGQQIFLTNTCVSCHSIAGTSAQGVVGPNLTHVGSRQTIGTGVVPNSPQQLAAWIKDPQAIKPGVHMPAYTIPDQDIQAIADYLYSLK